MTHFFYVRVVDSGTSAQVSFKRRWLVTAWAIRFSPQGIVRRPLFWSRYVLWDPFPLGLPDVLNAVHDATFQKARLAVVVVRTRTGCRCLIAVSCIVLVAEMADYLLGGGCGWAILQTTILNMSLRHSTR